MLPGKIGAQLAFLSGPSFAKEVGARAADGSRDGVARSTRRRGGGHAVSRRTASASTPRDDVTGVEIGGALKNVIAIAAGVADGLGFGHNTRAALITRGLAEIARLAVAQRRRPAHARGPRRHGRSGAHVHGRAVAQPHRRHRARQGPDARRDPRGHRPRRRGREDGEERLRSRRTSSASSCQSPTRCIASSTRISRRAKPSGTSWAARPSTSCLRARVSERRRAIAQSLPELAAFAVGVVLLSTMATRYDPRTGYDFKSRWHLVESFASAWTLPPVSISRAGIIRRFITCSPARWRGMASACAGSASCRSCSASRASRSSRSRCASCCPARGARERSRSSSRRWCSW